MSITAGSNSKEGRWLWAWLLLVVAALWDLFARQSNSASDELYGWMAGYGYMLGWVLLVFIPAIMMEHVLAHKSNALPVLAVEGYTREIDAPKYFRWPTVLAVGLVGVLVLLLLDMSAQRILSYTTLPVTLKQLAGWQLQLSSLLLLLLPVAAGVWLLMRYRLAMHVLAMAAAVALLAVGAWALATGQSAWTLLLQSPLHILSLLAVLTGLNLWWWAGRGSDLSPWRYALLQALVLLASVLGMLGVMLIAGSHQVLLQAVVAVLAAIWLGHMVVQAALAKNNMLLWTLVMLIALAVVVWQGQWVYRLLPSIALLLFAMQCVLVGWRMKVSHIRKLITLPNEALYNVWRVWVRLVMPGLSIMLAIQLLV